MKTISLQKGNANFIFMLIVGFIALSFYLTASKNDTSSEIEVSSIQKVFIDRFSESQCDDGTTMLIYSDGKTKVSNTIKVVARETSNNIVDLYYDIRLQSQLESPLYDKISFISACVDLVKNNIFSSVPAYFSDKNLLVEILYPNMLSEEIALHVKQK